MFVLKISLCFLFHLRHLFVVADLSNEEPKKMADIDAFAEKISKLISLSGTGYAKFKHLQEIFPSLESLTVAENLSDFFEADNKQKKFTYEKHVISQDLSIAAQKLRDIYVKFKIEQSADSMDSRSMDSPTQSLEEKTRRCMESSDNWNEKVTVPFKKLQLEVGNALYKNLTNLNNLSCSLTNKDLSPYKIVRYINGKLPFAGYDCIKEYGRGAVDHIYAMLYDYAFILAFYHAICSAGLDLQYDRKTLLYKQRKYNDQMIYGNMNYFNHTDVQLSDTVAKLYPTESTSESTFASIGASQPSDYSTSTVSDNSTYASTSTSKNSSEDKEGSSMPSGSHILMQKSLVQISLIFSLPSPFTFNNLIFVLSSMITLFFKYM